VPEELALEQPLGHRGAVDRDERPVRAPTAIVQCARDQLLAGAALASHQHRRVGVGDAVEEAVQALHGRAVAEERTEAAALRHGGAQPLHLRPQLAVLDGALQHQRHHRDLERLREEVVRARADGTDRDVEAAERGDHDHGHVGMCGDDALAQL